MEKISKNLWKKIRQSIFVFLFIALTGVIVYSVKRYAQSETGLNNRYQKELKGIIAVSDARKIITIKKLDVNEDQVEDYLVLIGEPKYEETDLAKVPIFQSMYSKIEMYHNISIQYVDGVTKQVNTYDTKKTYSPEVDFVCFSHQNHVYMQVSDLSGNLALLYLEEDTLKNVITNSIGEQDLVGYTIEGNLNEEEGVKLEVRLDNYGKDYLAPREEVYTLDYTDTQVNQEHYRLTYMANKFSKYELMETEDQSKLYLLCMQYILYANQEDLKKNEGYVITKFEVNEDNKLAYDSVTVTK